MGETQSDKNLLARRLEDLFQRSRPGGRRWTNEEVAKEIRQRNPELKVSASYLSYLRNGTRTNPSPELQRALAQFFGVTPAYFFDADYAESVNQQLEALELLKQANVRDIALRAYGLPGAALEPIKAVLDQIRQAQGLPPVEPDQDQGTTHDKPS